MVLIYDERSRMSKVQRNVCRSMIFSYYFWKWADNNLPGRPTDVHAALLRGEMPPALQLFDARPLIHKLRIAASRRQRDNEEWQWEVSPGGSVERARFVFVTCPQFEESAQRMRRFWQAFSALGLSGCDEQRGCIVKGLPPKLNCFFTGQQPSERMYDISQDDLPVLLRRVNPRLPDPFAILENQRGGFVQFYAERRRYCVEWAGNQFWPKTIWDQWRAQDADRLSKVGGTDEGDTLPPRQDPDLLRFSDTLRIFEAFFRGEPRPTQYPWRNINHLLQ